MAKEYHIVSGGVVQAVLEQSGSIDFSASNIEVICFNDSLAEGPLFDLRTLEGIEEREQYFAKFYGQKLIEKSKSETVYFFKPNNPEELENFNNDLYVDVLVHESELMRTNSAKKLISQLGEIDFRDSVYIWLGNVSNEYVLKSAVLNFLKDVSPRIYVIDWEKLIFKNQNGIDIQLYSINICSFENAVIAGKNFRLLTKEENQFFIELWERLLNSNRDFRILMFNKLVETDLTYFDNMIINRCTNKYTKNMRIVGNTLGDLIEEHPGNGIGDSFFFRRLEQLVELGILESRNIVEREGCFDLFEVRLAK